MTLTKVVTTITLENSLYAHSSALIEEFNLLTAKHEHTLAAFIEHHHINSQTDFFSSVFNYWLQLIEVEEICVPRVDKLIFHTFSFQMHKYLKLHEVTQHFLLTKPSREAVYIYAYLFAYDFLYYMHSHMPQTLVNQFIQDKDSINYFASKDQDLTEHQLLVDLYVFRKEFLYDIHNDMQIRYDLHQLLVNNVERVRQYFG